MQYLKEFRESLPGKQGQICGDEHFFSLTLGKYSSIS
jgi:hypothetical protein